MKVAMTGASGMLGGAVCAELLAQGHAVRALVRPRPDRDLLDHPALTWIEGNLDQPAALDRLVEGTDAILHGAYCPMEETPADGRTPGEHLVQTNLGGAVRLIERAATTTQRQLVFTSSLSVYGTASYADPAARHLPIDEGFPVWPDEFYGAHKVAIEQLVHAGSGGFGLNASSFRIGCVLGVYRDPTRGPVAKVVQEALEFGEIRTTTGAYVVSAADAARILVGALGDEAVRGSIFNTFDAWLDFAELAPVLGEITGRSIRVACQPAPEPRPGIENQRLKARHAHWTTGEDLRGVLAEMVEALSRR